jgi:anti-sigma regulatory factor (Ser/Thr protein kinase)
MASITVRSAASEWQGVERFVEAFAVQHGLPEDERSRLLIALEELLTNLVKYGYDPDAPLGIAEIALDVADDTLTIVFSDDGRPFDPLAAPPPRFEDTIEARPVGGLGLHMLRAFAHSSGYVRDGDRNRLTLGRRLKRAR